LDLTPLLLRCSLRVLRSQRAPAAGALPAPVVRRCALPPTPPPARAPGGAQGPVGGGLRSCRTGRDPAPGGNGERRTRRPPGQRPPGRSPPAAAPGWARDRPPSPGSPPPAARRPPRPPPVPRRAAPADPRPRTPAG